MEKKTKQNISFIYELILVILAIVSVFLAFSDNRTIQYLDKAVWLLFFLDVLIRFTLAKNKWKYVRENPFDIIAALPLAAIFQTARLARLFKLFRLIAISKNYFPRFFKILKTNNLDRILVVAVLMIVVGGTIATYAEPDIGTFADGLWWAIVTTTTVGYGDISPDSISGRITATFLMLAGIGIIGMLTSSITTFFIKEEEKEADQTIEYLHTQIDNINELTPQEISKLIALLHEYKKNAQQGK